MKTVTIPTRSLWSILIAIAIIGFAYVQAVGYILPGFEQINNLNEDIININNIGLMLVLANAYMIIAAFICMVLRIFKNLKPYKENGLIVWLIAGLIANPIGFLIWSPIGFLIWSPIGFLIWSFICFIIVTLLFGFMGEFKKGFYASLLPAFL